MGRIRGQEVTIRVTVDGQPQQGTWAKVKDFTVTPRTELVEEEYLGEQHTDLDKQHNGFDIAFSVDMQDRSLIDFLTQEISGEENQDALRSVTINVLYAFRDGANPVGETYFDAVLKVADQSFGGRQEYVSYSIEGKAKRRAVLELA